MSFKKSVPAVLMATVLSFSGCSTDNTDRKVTYFTDEDATYEAIIEAAEFEQKSGTADFMFGPFSKGMGIVGDDLIGISYPYVSEENVSADVYFGELEIDEFCKRVFNENYDSITIGDCFSAQKKDDDTYDVSYAALDLNKSSVYFLRESDESYLPSELENYEVVDNQYVIGYGNVSSDVAVEMFKDQINCSFTDISFDNTKSSSSFVKIKK